MKRLILDTDMGADCDDAVALALLLQKMRRGECEVLCVTAATTRRGAVAAIAAICSGYSYPDIPVGKMAPPPLACDKEDSFAEAVAKLYGKEDVGTDAVSLMRKTLEEAEEKVILAEIGPLTNVARLLRSPPDRYSDKTGAELVRRKAEALFVMGGSFSENYKLWGREGQSPLCEWNIAQDVVSARFVAENIPVPICFVPFEAGAEVYAEIRETENQPLWDCAREFARKYGLSCKGTFSRPCWDPVTCLCAVSDVRKYYRFSEFGKVAISKEGITTFSAEKGGNARIVLLRENYRNVAEELVGF